MLAALYNGRIPSLQLEINENGKLTRVIENSRNKNGLTERFLTYLMQSFIAIPKAFLPFMITAE